MIGRGQNMTGREAAMYILANGYDDKMLVIYIDGKAVQILDICYEIGRRELVILPDYQTDYQTACETRQNDTF